MFFSYKVCLFRRRRECGSPHLLVGWDSHTGTLLPLFSHDSHDWYFSYSSCKKHSQLSILANESNNLTSFFLCMSVSRSVSVSLSLSHSDLVWYRYLAGQEMEINRGIKAYLSLLYGMTICLIYVSLKIAFSLLYSISVDNTWPATHGRSWYVGAFRKRRGKEN